MRCYSSCRMLTFYEFKHWAGVLSVVLLLNVSLAQACVTNPVVTNGNASGAGSLADAVTNACADSTITFDNDYDIYLDAPLVTSLNLSIAADTTSYFNITIDGDSGNDGSKDVQLFQVTAGTLTLNALTLKNGIATNGGAVTVSSGATFSATDIFFVNNIASGLGGAVYNAGTVDLAESAFLNNAANDGGAVYSTGTGISNIEKSDFAYNFANGQGGALYHAGSSGLFENNFLVNNSAHFATGSGGGVYNSGTLTMNNCTLYVNRAGNTLGGNLGNSGTLTLTNSIVGNNNGGGDCNNGISFATNASNLFGDISCDGTATVDMKLAIDVDDIPNSMAVDSPAHDAGNNATCATEDRYSRARPINTTCDVGAFERPLAYIQNVRLDATGDTQVYISDADTVVKNENQAITLRYDISDESYNNFGGMTLSQITYDTVNGPSWLTLGGSGYNPELTGTPTGSGSWPINLIVHSGIEDVTFSFTLTIGEVNDAPVLTTTAIPTLTSILEDATAPSGDLLTAVVDSVLPTDLISDVDVAPLEGVAIIGVDSINGTWQYSLDSCSTWTTIGAVSTTSAVLLAADANSCLRFVPNANWNGVSSFDFHAWDQSNLGTVASGDTVNISLSLGGEHPYSSASETAQITVLSVNEAPNFQILGDRAHNISLTGVQTTPGWAHTFDFTPDVGDAVSSFIVNVLTDPNDILADGVAPAVSPAGELSYSLNGGSGTATLEVFLQDNAGTANGGVDLSAAQNFSVSKNSLTLVLNIANSTAEGEAPLSASLERTGDNSAAVDINLSSDNGKAGVPATVSFSSGQSTAAFSINIGDNNILDGTQNATITASHPDYASISGNVQIFDNDRLLSVDILSGEGSVSGAGVVTKNATILLQALPAPGWVLETWGGDCLSTGNVFMNADHVCTVSFVLGDFQLTSEVLSGEGTVSGMGTFRLGDTPQLTAQPALGWSLDAWGGDCNAEGQILQMGTDKHCTARFVQATFDLTLQANGNGTVNGDGSYPGASSVTLIATPAPGWELTNWSGACAGGTVLMDADYHCSANFSVIQHQLSVNVVGEGAVGGAGEHPALSTVSLTPMPAPGWELSQWSNNCTGGSVVMNADTVCTATFSQIQYAVTVSITGEGAINGAGDHPLYTVASLTAVPAAGWEFVAWGGDCLLNGQVVIDGDKQCTAEFRTAPPFALQVSSTGQGAVEGAGDYDRDILAQLRAIPTRGWQFDRWGGDCDVNGQVVMNAPKSCTALFTERPAGVQTSLEVNITGEGTVTGAGSYDLDSAAQLQATPASAWLFAGFGGDCDASGQVLMDNDKNCSASFVAAPTDDTPNPFENLGAEAFSALANSEFVNGLSVVEMYQLNAEQLGAIPATALAAMTPVQLASLQPDTIAGLTAQQIGALSAEAFGAVDSSFLNHLTSATLSGITAAQLSALDPAVVSQNMASTEVSRLMLHLDSDITPADVVALLPDHWQINAETGDFIVPPGTAISLREMQPSANTPLQLTLPSTFTDLNSRFTLGGQATADNSALAGMNLSITTSLNGGPVQDYQLNQDEFGILNLSADNDPNFRMAFIPDPNNILTVDKATIEVGVRIGEGGFIYVITPDGQQFRILPAPANPVALAQVMGADSQLEITEDGGVYLEFTSEDVNRRRGRARQVTNFQAFVEPAPDAFYCMAACGVIPPEQLPPELINLPPPPGCICDPAFFPPAPGFHQPSFRRIDSSLPLDNSVKARLVYPDGSSQLLDAAFIEPDIFAELGLLFEGVERVTRNANGSFEVIAAGQTYLVRPQYGLDSVEVPDSPDLAPVIGLNNGVLEYQVPFNLVDNTARRRGRARQVLNFQPSIEFIPEEFCHFEGGIRVCDFGGQRCTEFRPGDWQCQRL